MIIIKGPTMSNSITINNGAYICSYSDYVLTINSVELKATENVSCSAPVPNFSEIPNLSPNATVSLNMTFCGNRNVTEIDFTNWTHKKITSLYCAFSHCCSLKRIIGFETLDLSSCNDYTHICKKCDSLRGINMSNSRIKRWDWNMHKDGAFEQCSSLTTVVISENTPKFAFPSNAMIIDVSSGVYNVQNDPINVLRSELEAEKRRSTMLEERISTISAQLEELKQKL